MWPERSEGQGLESLARGHRVIPFVQTTRYAGGHDYVRLTTSEFFWLQHARSLFPTNAALQDCLHARFACVGCQNARGCGMCWATTRTHVHFERRRGPKRTPMRVERSNTTQWRAFPAVGAPKMHAAAYSGPLPHASTCIAHVVGPQTHAAACRVGNNVLIARVKQGTARTAQARAVPRKGRRFVASSVP